MASSIHFNISALFGQLAGISFRHGTFTIHFLPAAQRHGHKEGGMPGKGEDLGTFRS